MNTDNFFSSLNEKSLRVFGIIQKYGPITKTELCKILDKKMTPVNRMIEPLEERGLVIELSKANSTGGRKPMLYGISAENHYVGAINISTTYCEVAILNFRIEILQIDRFKISQEDDPDSILAESVQILEKQIQLLQLNKKQLRAIGLTTFSSYDPQADRIIKPIVSYVNKRWMDIPIRETISNLVRVPVFLEKGTNAAALLESLYGKGKGAKRVLYVLCAMNIRSAVISDGEIIDTAPNSEDSFGHMTINIDGEACPCGNYGCVSMYTTIPAIIKDYVQEMKKGRETIITALPDAVTFLDICDASRAGDALAVEVITRAANVLGAALANYINLFSPELVILSGLIIRNCELYYQVAIDTAQKKTAFLQRVSRTQFVKHGDFKTPLTSGAGSIAIDQLLRFGEREEQRKIERVMQKRERS